MFRTATADDMAEVVSNLRWQDVAEIHAVTGKLPVAALAEMDALPHISIALCREDKAVAIFGATQSGSTATMFRIATEEWPLVVREAIKFGRREMLPRFRQAGIKTVKATTLADPKATAWLRLFGATQIGPNYTRNGEQLSDFVLDLA